jgi:hypothetical protein
VCFVCFVVYVKSLGANSGKERTHMPFRQQDQPPIALEVRELLVEEPPPPMEPKRRRPRQVVIDDPPLPPPAAIRGWYRRIGTSIALLGAALLGGLMWYYGGVFTLDFLGDTFSQLGAFLRSATWWQQWWIPLVISAVEIFLWPRRERRLMIWLLRLGLWLGVLAFDVYTTARGLLPVVARQEVVRLADPATQRWVEIGISGAIGVAFAYLPEKIARWVLSDLWNLWVAPLRRWLRRQAQPEVQPAA